MLWRDIWEASADYLGRCRSWGKVVRVSKIGEEKESPAWWAAFYLFGPPRRQNKAKDLHARAWIEHLSAPTTTVLPTLNTKSVFRMGQPGGSRIEFGILLSRPPKARPGAPYFVVSLRVWVWRPTLQPVRRPALQKRGVCVCGPGGPDCSRPGGRRYKICCRCTAILRFLFLLYTGAFAGEGPVGVEENLFFALRFGDPIDGEVLKEVHAMRILLRSDDIEISPSPSISSTINCVPPPAVPFRR